MQRPDGSALWNLLDGSPIEWARFAAGLIAVVILSWAIFKLVAHVRGIEDPAAAEQLMLTQIGDLHREGDLSQEEYRSIKSRLVDRIEEVEDQVKSEG